ELTSALAAEVHHPVRLPGLSVEREGLLPVRAPAGAALPDEAHLHRTPALGVVAVEDAAIALEPAMHRRPQDHAPGVRPVDGPATLALVEEPDRHPGELAGGELDLVDVHPTAESVLEARVARELLPDVIAVEPAA